MNEAIALDDARDIPSLRAQLTQAPTSLAKLDVAKSILAAREEAAKPAALVANDVAVPLDPLLVEWTPRFSNSFPPEFRTLPRRNQHLLFSTGVDLGMMQLTATATFEGEKSSGADRAASDLAKIKACEAAGYMRQRVKMAGLNILGFVFVKDGLAVTPEGAAKLAGVQAPAPAVSKARVTKAEARDAYDTLSYLLTSYQQHHDSELLRVDLSERLLPLVENVKTLVQRGWPEGVSDPAYLLEKAAGTIARQDRLKAEGLTKDMGRGEARDYLRNKGLSPERIEAVLANPTSVSTSGMHEVPQYTMAYLNSEADKRESTSVDQNPSQPTDPFAGNGSRTWLVENLVGYCELEKADNMVGAIQVAMNKSDYTLPSSDWTAVEVTATGWDNQRNMPNPGSIAMLDGKKVVAVKPIYEDADLGYGADDGVEDDDPPPDRDAQPGSYLVLKRAFKTVVATRYLSPYQDGETSGALPASEAKPAPADNDLTRLNALKRLAPKGAITSDDPQALEKLRAKLAALMAEQEFMKKANRLIKSGNDKGLTEMGLNQVTIEGLKKPDFAGRIGFADYMLSNNNGVIGTTRKRIAAMEADAERARALQQAESGQQAEETDMQKQGGQGAEAVSASGSRRWLVTNMLGYRAEHQADTMVEAIQQAMNGSDYTLPSRDWSAVEITGGGQPSPEPAAPSVAEVIQKEDQGYLQSIIDGTINLLDPEIFNRLEPMFTKYADDAEMMGLLNRAAEAYEAAAVAAAKGA